MDVRLFWGGGGGKSIVAVVYRGYGSVSCVAWRVDGVTIRVMWNMRCWDRVGGRRSFGIEGIFWREGRLLNLFVLFRIGW